MKSAILQHDHDELVSLSRSLSPRERLVAFYHHSLLLARLSRTPTGVSIAAGRKKYLKFLKEVGASHGAAYLKKLQPLLEKRPSRK